MSGTPRPARRASAVNFRLEDFPTELTLPERAVSRRPSAVKKQEAAKIREDEDGQQAAPPQSRLGVLRWPRRASISKSEDSSGRVSSATLSVPRDNRSRRPSAVEVVDDGLSGQLVVPIYDEDETGSTGLPSVPRQDEDQPASSVQGVPLFPSHEEVSDADSETDGSEEDVLDGTYVCRITSVLSRVGVATDLATIWRIPYMTHKYGVCFLMVYLLLTLLVGLPIYYMEFALGQFSSRGAIQVWKFAPIFAGFGYAMVLLSFLIAVYGSVVVAWSFLYLISSMNKDVLWQNCNKEWSIDNCTEVFKDYIIIYPHPGDNGTVVNGTSWMALPNPISLNTDDISSHAIRITNVTVSTEAFFWYDVADRAEPHTGISYQNWRLMLCLLVIWCFIGFTFSRKYSYKSKVLNVAAALMYIFFVLMMIIGIFAVTEGAYTGLSYLFKMPWTSLKHSEIWLDGFGQLVLSYGVCTGGVLCLGSRHRFRHNTRRDVIIVFCLKLVVALLVTLTTFILLGFLAERLKLRVADVVKIGPEMLFIVASQALLLLPQPPVWSVLFFFCLVLSGHNYLCTWVDPVLRAPLEVHFNRWRRKRMLVVVVGCLLMLVVGLALVGSHGLYLMTALDRHLLTWAPLVTGAVESIALCWVYGVDKWAANVDVMLGVRPSLWWRTTWKVVVPVVHTALLLFGLIGYTRPRYGSDQLPQWVSVVAGLVGMAPLLLAFILLTLDAVRSRRSERGGLWRPDASWGPVKEQHRWQTYGVTFVAPEPILMVHVDSILKPELYGGIPHGYYLHRDAKDAEAADVLRQQEELRKALQRKLMAQKQLSSVSKKVMIQECPASSESGSDSTVSSTGSCSSTETPPVPGTRRKSILVQAALLRKKLESSLGVAQPAGAGAHLQVPSSSHGEAPRRHSCVPAPSQQRSCSVSSGGPPSPADPALTLDPARLLEAGSARAHADPAAGRSAQEPARLLTLSEETGCENAGYETPRRRHSGDSHSP